MAFLGHRQRLGVFILSVAVLSGCSLSSQEKSWSDSLRKGLQELKAGNGSGAAVDLATAVKQIDASDPESPDRVTALTALGKAYLDQGKLQDAERSLQLAASTAERKFGPASDQLMEASAPLSKVLNREKKFAESKEAASKLFAGREQKYGKNSAETEEAMTLMLSASTAEGHGRADISLLKKLLELREQKYGESHQFTCVARQLLAEEYIHNHDFAPAEILYKRNVELLTTTNPAGVRGAKLNLARVFNAEGKHGEALKIIEKVLKSIGQASDPVAENLKLQGLDLLAECYEDSGQKTQAVKTYEELIRLLPASMQTNSTALTPYLVKYSQILKAAGLSKQAKAVEAKIDRLSVQSPSASKTSL